MATAPKPRPPSRQSARAPAVDYGKIVDSLQRVRADIKALEADEKHLKQQLLDGGARSYRGTTVSAIVSNEPQTRLDTEAVKVEMGTAWYEAHSKTVPVTKIKLEAHVPA